MNISRERSCDGKARHSSKTAANTARRLLVGRIGARRGDIDVYACLYCGGYHVGHQPRGQR